MIMQQYGSPPLPASLCGNPKITGYPFRRILFPHFGLPIRQMTGIVNRCGALFLHLPLIILSPEVFMMAGDQAIQFFIQ